MNGLHNKGTYPYTCNTITTWYQVQCIIILVSKIDIYTLSLKPVFLLLDYTLSQTSLSITGLHSLSNQSFYYWTTLSLKPVFLLLDYTLSQTSLSITGLHSLSNQSFYYWTAVPTAIDPTCFDIFQSYIPPFPREQSYREGCWRCVVVDSLSSDSYELPRKFVWPSSPTRCEQCVRGLVSKGERWHCVCQGNRTNWLGACFRHISIQFPR